MSVFLRILRRLARLSGLVVAGGYAVIVIGDFATAHSLRGPDLLAWMGILLMTTSCAAMLFAWRWELSGAIVSLAALAGFTALRHFNNYRILVVLTLPGILILTYWLIRFTTSPARRHPPEQPSFD